jgi:hypothetical protein
MNCTAIRDVLPALLYDDLPPDEAARLHKHLAGCSACKAEYEALRRLRQGLDRLPAPGVQVDLARLYREAVRFQEGRLRRWRRAAAVMVAAAALVLLAFLLNLEVRVDGHQLVVRWGSPPEPVAPTPMIVQAPPAPPAISAEEVRLLRDLIHALAADVEDRDYRRQQALARLQLRLETLQTQTERRLADNERTSAAFYTALFGPRNKKGERP